VWAGVIPLRLVAGEPVPNADFDSSLAAVPTVAARGGAAPG
jgi:hypothetical protein